MAFLYPAFLIGALAIAIPIVLHLLRRDVAPEMPFTAVRLLRRSPVERAERRRLRDLLLLLARVTALLLLAAAFARPYVRSAIPERVRVVAVDRSYSMSGPGRFARALALARASIDQAHAAERIAVVAFDDRADVLVAPGGAADARAALEGLEPGFGATRYSPVVQKALDLAAGVGGRLVIVTDLQRAGWEGEPTTTLPPGWQLEIQDVGPAAANVAVTSVGVETDRVVASIRNAGSSARTGRVRASLDGRNVAEAQYAVQAGEVTEVPIAWRAPANGALAVSVDDAEGFAADNSRYVALGSRGTAKALIVTAGGQSGLYLSRALQTSVGEDGGFHVEVVQGSRLAAMPPEQVSSYPIVAVLSTRGLERRARETLGAHIRNGAGLLIAAAPDLEVSVLAGLADWQPPFSAADHAEQPLTLAATDLRHPIFRPFGALSANLGQVRFDRTWRVPPDGWSVVARFSNGTPALLERSLGQGRVVLFASDVDRRWNDFPLHPAFVPFALEAVRYAAGDRQHAREFTIAQAPAGTGPGPGVYRAPDNRVVAVNVDTRESGLDRISAEAFDDMVQRSGVASSKGAELQAQQTESRQSYWQYGLALMIATLVAESVFGRA